MKALKPTMREDKRYLVVKGKNIEKAIFEFLGVLGMSKVGLNFIKPNIICVNREMVDKVRASFCVSKDKIEVLKVSGSLKGLK